LGERVSCTCRGARYQQWRLSALPTSQSPDNFGCPGGTPGISANGNTAGIVWDLDTGSNELRAYDASNYATELYTSAQAANNRDLLGSVVKFTVPIVVDGKVYVNTSDNLVVYGLFPTPTSPPLGAEQPHGYRDL
jgi:hypothetical protein